VRVLTLLLLLPSAALAAGANATWTANSEPDLAGYELHYGLATATYDGNFINSTASPLDVPVSGLSTPGTPDIDLIGIPSCTSTFFALKAYDFSGNRSAFGSELEGLLPATPSSVSVSEISPGSITLSWVGIPAGDAGSIDRYRIHYGASAGGPYDGTGAGQGVSPIEHVSAAASPSQQIDGLSTMAATYFVIDAVCDNNGETRTSAEVSYNGPVAPDGGGADGGPAGDSASPGDSGTTTGDSGTTTGDSGTSAGDSGGTPPGSKVVGGCGCGAAAAPWALVALVLFARRRRR